MLALGDVCCQEQAAKMRHPVHICVTVLNGRGATDAAGCPSAGPSSARTCPSRCGIDASDFPPGSAAAFALYQRPAAAMPPPRPRNRGGVALGVLGTLLLAFFAVVFMLGRHSHVSDAVAGTIQDPRLGHDTHDPGVPGAHVLLRSLW